MAAATFQRSRDMDRDTVCEYDRVRGTPRPGDDAYLHLSDLVAALRPRLERARGAWLDFGSGTSPYRAYMTGVELLRADLTTTDEDYASEPDYLLSPGDPCPAPDGAFDGVLSTQVLEHVEDPPAYLADALRMLRPGGELLLSTHGIWHDHPCPLDLRRWTAQGLRHEVEQAGFEVTEVTLVTCAARAALVLMSRELWHTSWTGRYRTPTGLVLGVLRLLEHRPRAMHRHADRALADQRVVREGEAELYLGLVVSARRPANDLAPGL
jgi:SAM-dependent methyltransferase